MENYVYVILDITESGEWKYKDKTFINKPIYVGMGIGNRYLAHFTLKLYSKESNFTKHKLIKKLIESGNKPLSIKVFENLDREKAKEIEIDMIKHFGKSIDGSGILTNITDGGDETRYNKLGGENPHSKKVYQYALDGGFIKQWDCLREIGRELKVAYNTIGDCCRGKSHTAYKFQWSYIFTPKGLVSINKNDQPKRRKPVYKFDCYGKIVSKYESLNQACLDNGMTKSNLSSHIIGNKIYHNNFYSYIEDFVPEIKINTRKIEYNGDIMELTNKQIMGKFNVGNSYYAQVRSGRIKNSKFKVIF